MPSCIVNECTNRSSAKSYRQEKLEETIKITFHAFPKCPMKHQLWLNSLGIQNSVLPKRPIVCSLHFRHEDMDRTSLVCVRLRENAIPYVTLPKIRNEDNINVCKEISTEEPSTSTSSAVIKVETDDSVEFTKPISIAGGKRRHLVNTGPHEVSEKVFKIESESQTEHIGVSLVDKFTFVSPKRLFHSPRKQMLRNHIRQLKRRH